MKKKTKRSRYEIDIQDVLLCFICLALFLLFIAQWTTREQQVYAYIDRELKEHNEYQKQVEQDKYDERQKQFAMEKNYE